MSIDVVSGRKVPRHHGSTARRTNATSNSEAMKVRPLTGKPINIWCFHIRVTMAAQITPSPVISKDENNVGLLSGTRCTCLHSPKQRQEQTKHTQIVSRHNRLPFSHQEGSLQPSSIPKLNELQDFFTAVCHQSNLLIIRRVEDSYFKGCNLRPLKFFSFRPFKIFPP